MLVQPVGFRTFFACPLCRQPLETFADDCCRCPNDGLLFSKQDGVWHFLRPGRETFFAQFIQEYETVRRAEGRAASPDFYRSLPYPIDREGISQSKHPERSVRRERRAQSKDATAYPVRQLPADWRIRAAGFQMLIDTVLRPAEGSLNRPLSIIDLGAGNCWLSNRLAQRGHALAAVDLAVNDWDGLGTYSHYETIFEPIQAEFDALPLLGGCIDLAIFNASLHYSTGYECTLAEALRVLRPGGKLVVLDSPVYHDPESGRQMVAERENAFTRQYGFPSNALPNENYLTVDRLDKLAATLKLSWESYHPFYGLGWALRGWKAKLRRRREPAQLMLLAAEKPFS